jgi:hypothetical protein
MKIQDFAQIIKKQFHSLIPTDKLSKEEEKLSINVIDDFSYLVIVVVYHNTPLESCNIVKIGMPFSDSLMIYKCENCYFTGPEILICIFKAALELGTNISIDLQDDSKIIYPNCEFGLLSYHSLLYGQTWYNKFGYYTDNHIQCSKILSKLRKKNIMQYSSEMDAEKTKNVVQFIKYMNPSKSSDNLTVADAMQLMKEKLVTLNEKQKCKLIKLFNKLSFDEICHNEDDVNVTLEVNEKTKLLYKELEKQYIGIKRTHTFKKKKIKKSKSKSNSNSKSSNRTRTRTRTRSRSSK